MNIKFIHIICLLFLLLPLSVEADNYYAPFNDTNWHVSESKLQCAIMQTIPNFGIAGFVKKAGMPMMLVFKTQTLPSSGKDIQFMTGPAIWQKSGPSNLLATLPSKQGQVDFILKGLPVKQAFTQMREGLFPTLHYDTSTYQGGVNVMLSTIHFDDQLPKAYECIRQLAPDSFENIHKLTVYFANENAFLTESSQKALAKVGEYVNADKSIRYIQIIGYTDNRGRKSLNQSLSLARAKSVQAFLMQEFKIPENKFTIMSKFYHNPVASNKTAHGRAQNRRVEVNLMR